MNVTTKQSERRTGFARKYPEFMEMQSTLEKLQETTKRLQNQVAALKETVEECARSLHNNGHVSQGLLQSTISINLKKLNRTN